MKHLSCLTLATLLVLTALPASAQSIHAFGVKGGLTSSSQGGGFTEFYEERGGESSRRAGISLGGFLQIAADLPFVVQPEVLFTMKGHSLGGDAVIERDISMNYLDIPVLARFDFESESIAPFVVAGPVVSLLVSSSGEREGVEIDIDDEVKSTDFGLGVGAGASFGLIDVELRYTHGLVNVTTSDSENESAKNRIFGILVGYTLGGPGAMR